jgi:outer membrane immunogenic protein
VQTLAEVYRPLLHFSDKSTLRIGYNCEQEILQVWGLAMKTLSIAFAALAFTGSAYAADLPMKVPAAAPAPAPPLWTGFYIGGHVGGLWTKADGNWDPLPNPGSFGANPISGDFNESRFVGGVQGGYNWQFAPAWVAGIEGDWSWTNASGGFTTPWTQPGTNIPNGANFFTTMNMELKWLATLRGRIGYLVVPQALVYFTGGVAWGDVDYSAHAQNPATYVADTSFSDTSTGYVLGGGVEWLFASHWMLRGEYLFYHLNSGKSVLVNDSTGNFPGFPSGFNWGDLDVSVVRAALSYKF